jgi:protein disulfide-isomerase A6
MWSTLYAVLVLALAALAAASDVTVLTPDNFKTVVDGSKHVLVKFYAPWCGHCKALAPTYEKVATDFHNVADVVVAELDADAHKDLAHEFGVTGYPTLKFFPKGKTEPEDYSAGREEEDFIQFLNDKVGAHVRVVHPPSAVTVLTDASFDQEVLASKKHALVEFYAPWCGHCKALAPTYEEVATVFAGEDSVLVAKVDATAEKALADRYGVQSFPTLKYFAPEVTKAEDKPEDYTGGRDKLSFVEFLNEKAGTKRTPEGGLSDEAGRVKELDDMIAKAGKVTSKVVSNAEAAVKKLQGDAAKYGELYVKAMKKIVAKGSKYIDSESKRLEGLLENPNVTPAKKTLFALRKNILAAFSPKKEEAEEAKPQEKEEL